MSRPALILHSLCAECGAAVAGSYKGKPLRFCLPTEGRKESSCKKRFNNRKPKTAEFYRKKYLREKSDPKQRAARLRYERRRDRQKYAASKRVGRARYNLINDTVPKHFLRDTRMEIVAEACLLYAEGYTLDEAVRLATKRVNKGNEFQNFKSRDIDDCFWLAEESEEVE